MFKQQKGITLIALVITIIVLLILAGITIAMLTGSDSAPAKAQQASKDTKVAEAKEQAAMDIINAYTTFIDYKYAKSAPELVDYEFIQFLRKGARVTVPNGNSTATVTCPAFATSNANAYTATFVVDAETGENISRITIVPQTSAGKIVIGDITEGGSIEWSETTPTNP